MTQRAPHYLRFIVQDIDPDSGVPAGVFGAAIWLRDNADTPAFDRMSLEHILDWFDDHMEVPTRFNRTKSKAWYLRGTRGISWLKAHSYRHIAKMREMAAVLTENGYVVDQINTDRPGYIVYEDRYQIVAEPFADTPTSR